MSKKKSDEITSTGAVTEKMDSAEKKQAVKASAIDILLDDLATEEKPDMIVELNEKLLRNYAEFDNFKKRTAKEKLELATYTKANCFTGILSVVDNFERALECESKDGEFKKGMQMILAQLNNALTEQGIVEIEALNKPFDPLLHNAINQVESDTLDSGTVCGVMQKGYAIGDKVVRHSMVSVVA